MGHPSGSLEERFHEAMLGVYESAKRDYGYKATYFVERVRSVGGVNAAKQLLRSTKPSTGLLMLRDRNALGISMEAVIVENPEWWPLFTEQEIDRAEQCLRSLGYEPRRRSPSG